MSWIDEVQMVYGAAKSFPKIALGHGSRHEAPGVLNCVVPRCVHPDKETGRPIYKHEHFQSQIKAALAFFAERGIRFRPMTMLCLKLTCGI